MTHDSLRPRARRAHGRAILGLLIVALAAGLLASRAVAQLPLPLAAALAERIEREMADQNIVGLSAAFVIDGELAGTLHFGWADRDNQIPAGDETLYRWASISKPLTAVVAMQLLEQGRLDLDRDVREYVPEFPAKPWTITSLQLLCHQGGIVHYRNGPVVRTEREYDVEHPFVCTIATLDNFNLSPLVCEPGTAYAYTTHGYLLLAAAVERAGGETYPEQVRRRIIEPLGLRTLQPDYEWIDIPNRAAGYRPAPRRQQDGEGNDDGEAAPPLPARLIPSADVDVSWKLGGGGWISSVVDLALFGRGLLDETLVGLDTRGQMFTARPLADGSPTSYGLGFRINSLDGIDYAEHGGSQQKTRTRLLICPETGSVVALMCNTEGTNFNRLAPDMLRLIRQHAATE